MKYVSVYELRKNMAELLNLVAKGDSVVVTKNKKPIAKIGHYKEEKGESPIMKFYGMLADKENRETGEEFVNRVRRNKYEKNRVKYFRNWSKKK